MSVDHGNLRGLPAYCCRCQEPPTYVCAPCIEMGDVVNYRRNVIEEGGGRSNLRKSRREYLFHLGRAKDVHIISALDDSIRIHLVS